MFDRIFLVISVKKLLLCILSLILCLNTSVIHAQEPESLMIVAHPDDETIWGGSHLINGNYTVLCITNGNINVNLKMYSFDHLRMYNIDHINTFCSRR